MNPERIAMLAEQLWLALGRPADVLLTRGGPQSVLLTVRRMDDGLLGGMRPETVVVPVGGDE